MEVKTELNLVESMWNVTMVGEEERLGYCAVVYEYTLRCAWDQQNWVGPCCLAVRNLRFCLAHSSVCY